MSKYKRELIAEAAQALHSYGYQVYLAKSKDYGFYTDGKAVVCFGGQWHFSLDFSGNYSATTSEAARRVGTGWQIAGDAGIPTSEEAKRYITAKPPYWAVHNDDVTMTTPQQHLKTYGQSSGYTLYGGEQL